MSAADRPFHTKKIITQLRSVLQVFFSPFPKKFENLLDNHRETCYYNTVVADVAQQVERILGKDEVTGSNPVISSSKPVRNDWFFVFLG